MRILQVAPYFPPYVGGQERFVYCLSRELTRKGFQVTVATANVPRGLRHEWIDGIEVVRYASLGQPLRNPITPGLLLRLRRLPSFDLIHAHNEHSFCANVAVVHKRLFRLPLVLTCHGQLVFDSPLADMFREFYWRTVGRATLRSADRITVATPSERRRLVSKLNLDAESIDLVPIGIDLDHWDGLIRDQASTTGGFIHPPNRRVILAATQLIRRKGLHHLIHAMPRVISRCPDALCVIAGTGDYETTLRMLVAGLGLQDRVLFTGLLKDRELAQAYQDADVFVLPSLGEGQPTCIMEAWAFSKPVVATRIEGVTDYFAHAAVLVEPNRVEPLARAIIEVLSDPHRAAQLGEKGRRLVESTFTWDRVVERMIRSYEQALAARHDGG